MANTDGELLRLQSLLKELGIFLIDPLTLLCYNLSVTYLSVNPVLNSSAKHLDLDYHFVKDRVAAKTLHVAFVSSTDQLADILTKPLSTTRFSLLWSSLNIIPMLFVSGEGGANRAKDDLANDSTSTEDSIWQAQLTHTVNVQEGNGSLWNISYNRIFAIFQYFIYINFIWNIG